MLYGDLKAKKLSPQRYISGRLALSIEAEGGDSGDWRSAAALWNEKAKTPRYGVMGQGERYDHPVFGLAGRDGGERQSAQDGLAQAWR